MMSWLVLFSFFILCSHTGGQIVDTEYGPVQGNTVTLEDGTEIFTFYGIPFAEPPVGDLRFQPPEEPQPWTDVLEANVLPPACPQNLTFFPPWPGNPEGITTDEDCLYLNVYTPGIQGNNLAVMVYIHGGGYQTGTGVFHPGHFLAAKDVVTVTINYRLGALGFMTTSDEVAPGNYGMLDQIKSLQFVRDNIVGFGGDPNQVTIFGESAGGSSVALLGLSPRADGLFHEMITMSGSDQNDWAFMGTVHEPEQYTRQVAAQLNCPTEDSLEMMDCLKTVPWQEIWDKVFECKVGYVCAGFSPVLDGDVFPDHPWNLRRSGQFAQVPLISGMTSEEGSLEVLSVAPETGSGGISRERFLHFINMTIYDRINVEYPGKEEEVFEAFNFLYTPWPHVDDGEANRHALVELYSDKSFGVGIELQILFQAEVSPVFQYIFSYTSENKPFPEWMGVVHAEDLSYTFGTPLLHKNPEVRNDSKIFEDELPWNEQDIEWADFLMTLWTNFAKFKNPTPVPITPPGSDTPVTWTERTNESHRYFFMHATDTAMLQDYRSQEMAFWLDYLPYIVGERPSYIPQL